MIIRKESGKIGCKLLIVKLVFKLLGSYVHSRFFIVPILEKYSSKVTLTTIPVLESRSKHRESQLDFYVLLKCLHGKYPTGNYHIIDSYKHNKQNI